MKVFENDIVYDWSPPHVITQIFKKYPNPHATHVQSVDTLSRTIDPETGIIRTERMIGVVQGAPKWVAKLLHLPPTAYVREIIFIDPSLPSATAMSVNLSLSEYLSCLELIRYTPHPPSPPAPPPDPTDPSQQPHSSWLSFFDQQDEEKPLPPGYSASKTLFWQRAILESAFPTALVARQLEKSGFERFKTNAGVGKMGFEWVLRGGRDPPKKEKRKR